MNLFENLFGGQQRQGAEDFLNRYQQGHPTEGYSEEEVMQHYQTATGSVPDDIYEQSAEESFARLSPQERKEFFQFGDLFVWRERLIRLTESGAAAFLRIDHILFSHSNNLHLRCGFSDYIPVRRQATWRGR
jgi:hypothetical protein